MSGLKFHRVALKVEFALLALLIVSATLWRWLNIPTLAVDPDEVFLIGAVDRAESGDAIYRHHIDGHVPLLHQLYRPILWMIGERSDYLVRFRQWVFPTTLSFIASLIFAAWRVSGRRGAAWTVGLWVSFPFLAPLQSQVRYDFLAAVPFLIAGGLLVNRDRVETARTPRIAAGVLLGVSAVVHVTAPYYAAAFCVWVLIVGRPEKKGLAWSCAFTTGILAVGTWLVLMAVFLKFHVADGLTGLARALVFDRVYQTEIGGASGFFLPEILVSAPLPWLMTGYAAVLAHLRAATGRDRSPGLLLFMILFDFGVAAVATRLPDYPQRYVPLAVGGCPLVGVMIARWLETPRFQWSRTGTLQGSAIALALGLWAMIPLWHRSTEPLKPPALPIGAVLESEGREASISADSLLSWWSASDRDLSPFHPRTPAELEAVSEFILRNTSRSDVVYTDWMNPPFRPLPIPHNHGMMIVEFEDSEVLRRDAAAVEDYRYYNPAYDPEHPSLPRVFERTDTRIILLDGSIGQAIRSDPEFKRWLTGRYDFVLETRFLNAFAVARDDLSVIH